MANLSGTKSLRRSRPASCNLSEVPRTRPFWLRFMRRVENPAIWYQRRLEGIRATSSSRSSCWCGNQESFSSSSSSITCRDDFFTVLVWTRPMAAPASLFKC
ncbi:hypothetical protein SLEP1_g19082 [Rubroshorea leprosula]|nr:hypothetical protein SLEP1_g19082 [Rubroshorea leprosula]